MEKSYKIATIGSHSALQILKGAKDEGFETIAICKKGFEEPYKSYNVADEILFVKEYTDILNKQQKFISEKVIIVPHGSFIAYMGYKNVEKMKIPYFGNKKILHFESDRTLERKWLKNAAIKMPAIFKNPEDIDRLVIVKFHGAGGGSGYFLATNKNDFYEKIKIHSNKKYIIQEYIVGVHMYVHYFYSPITKELEILSFDKRYESNVDSIGRISSRDQLQLPKSQVDPSYVIVGNIPLIVRESLLPELFKMGHNIITESKLFDGIGLFGPFCLETVITPDKKIFAFEISARIVAGTNPFINGSPYSWLKYNKPMSTGRRIALEIKTAIKNNKLNLLLH